ncbi:hypothetical protein RugamoR64_56280 [Duganella rhizosphaerae]
MQYDGAGIRCIKRGRSGVGGKGGANQQGQQAFKTQQEWAGESGGIVHGEWGNDTGEQARNEEKCGTA